MAKELRGARACRTLGRDVGAVAEMLERGIVSRDEARDLWTRLRRELEDLNARHMLNPHQYQKVLEELAACEA